jgi:hypothetical protein
VLHRDPLPAVRTRKPVGAAGSAGVAAGEYALVLMSQVGFPSAPLQRAGTSNLWLSAAYGHNIEATEALTPGVLGQRLFDATLGGRSLSLGIVDRRFGQLGDPINGCDGV